MSLWNTVPCTMKSGQKKSNVSHRTWGVWYSLNILLPFVFLHGTVRWVQSFTSAKASAGQGLLHWATAPTLLTVFWAPLAQTYMINDAPHPKIFRFSMCVSLFLPPFHILLPLRFHYSFIGNFLYNVFRTYPLLPLPISLRHLHPLSTSQLHSFSSFFITVWVQLALPRCAWVWGHPLEPGQPTRGPHC